MSAWTRDEDMLPVLLCPFTLPQSFNSTNFYFVLSLTQILYLILEIIFVFGLILYFLNLTYVV